LDGLNSSRLYAAEPEGQRRNVKKDRASLRDNIKEYDSEERKSIWQKKISEEIKVEMFPN